MDSHTPSSEEPESKTDCLLIQLIEMDINLQCSRPYLLAINERFSVDFSCLSLPY